MPKASPSVPPDLSPMGWPRQVALVVVSAVAAWAVARWWNATPASASKAAPSTASVVGAPGRSVPAVGAPAPEGMAWIGGGEFSMGADDPRSLPNGGPDPMPDARPVHRVAV